MNSFMAALSGVVMLFIFIVSGYILRKKEIAKEGSARMLSALLINYFQPIMMIHIITENITADNLKTTYPVLILSFVVIALSYAVALPVSRLLTKNKRLRDVIIFALVYSNFGFMGIPVIEAVYGTQQFMFLMMYTVPYYLTVNILGDYILRDSEKFNFKAIFQPVTYGILIGILLVIAGVKPSGTIGKWIEYSYNCVIPLSMILAGMVLGERKFGDMFKNPVVYVVTMLRNIILPLILFAVLKLCGFVPADLGVAVLIMGMPVAANAVMLAENVDADSFSAAQCVFISTAFSLITIPALTFIVTM